MRNLALMWVLAGIVGLAVGEGGNGRMADSVDADYCLDLGGDTAKAVFLKSYNSLKPALLNVQDNKIYICLDGERTDTTATFYFYDKQPIFGGTTHYFYLIDGTPRDDTLFAPKHKFSPVIQIHYPKSVPIYLGKRYSNKDLLQFKNKTVSASIDHYFQCKPDLDTIIYTPFRAKITGECECDLIKESQK